MSDSPTGPNSKIGSYEVLDEIGRGALGVVYRSRHVHLGRLVALKVLHPLWTSSDEFVDRFRDEGRLMALLEHPNILRVYDAGQADEHFFLAMAYLEGKTLESVMRGPVPLEQGLRYVRQIARALAYAGSQGIVHRDVKPANVMVGSDGHVTLMDFGVARLKDAPGMTLPGIRVGTPYYMAPEQILGRRVDGRADVYALGVILHRLLTGRLPFPGTTTEEVFEGQVHCDPPELDPELPEWLRRAARKALAKDPDQRFADAQEMFNALDPHGSRAAACAVSTSPLLSGTTSPGATAETPAQAATGPRSSSHTRHDRTALSLDVVGSARMKHPGATMVVQEQFTHFRSYIRQHLEAHACLDSLWSGDGLLALFASPRDGAACAAAIVGGLPEFNADRGAGWDQMKVRIGVHRGPVLMADGMPLGEVMSRTLDVAGHLQKSCPEDSTLMSESTLFGLPDQRGWSPAATEYALLFPFAVYQAQPPAPPVSPEAAGAIRLEVASRGKIRTLDVAGEMLIGRPDPASRRVPEVDLRTDDAVSRRHARIFPADSGFHIEDLDSANGTRLNGVWLEANAPAPLVPGDTIELGEETVIRVVGA